jgi:hypothetical protein
MLEEVSDDINKKGLGFQAPFNQMDKSIYNCCLLYNFY